MPSVFYIIPLFFITITLSALIKNNMLRVFTLFIFNLIIIGEIVSVYFSGGLIDYQFYVNLNVNDIISGLFIFKYQALLCIICFFIILFICYKLSAVLSNKLSRRHTVVLFALFLSLICYKNGPVSHFYEIYEVTTAKPTHFDLSLKSVFIDPQSYPDKKHIKATQGKNIIVISLESLEQGFLSPTFNHLTPNLEKLSQEFSYYKNMPMMPGSTWTLASMYTYMTGVPLFLGGYNTYLFDDKKQSKLVSLGDVLNQAGYQNRYIIGNPEFAGMGQAISLFGIPIVSEKTYPGRYPSAPFGLYDRDVFDLAKHEIEQLKEDSKPFAVFISTVSTHAPNGFYDKRMESVITPQTSDLEFTIASVDYNLGLFITYLKQNNLLDNSVIYIFPDHQMMGYGTEIISKLSQSPRKLYLMTNADEQTLKKSLDETLYQIDLPRIIIDGAGINTNAKFLTDYLKNSEKEQFIDQNKSNIAVLNSSSLTN